MLRLASHVLHADDNSNRDDIDHKSEYHHAIGNRNHRWINLVGDIASAAEVHLDYSSRCAEDESDNPHTKGEMLRPSKSETVEHFCHGPACCASVGNKDSHNSHELIVVRKEPRYQLQRLYSKGDDDSHIDGNTNFVYPPAAAALLKVFFFSLFKLYTQGTIPFVW